MIRVRARGEDVRRFILEQVGDHPDDIAKVTAQRFEISRQAVNRHLRLLVAEGALVTRGATRGLSYHLAPLSTWRSTYSLSEVPQEDLVWTRDVKARLSNLPENVLDIWHYGFTEMLNNAIDHSGGQAVSVDVKRTAVSTQIIIHDDGVGIFRKIQSALGLLDERHAILELAKGKLTTDPRHHSGEGIFFTSRMFDLFAILSGGVYFSHRFGNPEDWIFEKRTSVEGTLVAMELNNHTARTSASVFSQFSSGPEEYGFTKTVVPVELAQVGGDKLISRSQAKRLLARVELFKTVIFDFKDVAAIGQAFADEIFRVFAKDHPAIELLDVRANEQVRGMIARARSRPDLDVELPPETG
ncbi:MAG: DUF4325 domain-containing protein [Deltaproteobacteria bacterium]|nr:DUF4325 domain-containing protein [Deltaproteobacteria bacterium]